MNRTRIKQESPFLNLLRDIIHARQYSIRTEKSKDPDFEHMAITVRSGKGGNAVVGPLAGVLGPNSS